MTLGVRDIVDLRFSTADWSERDRLPIFREQIGRMMVGLDPEPLTDGAFHAEANIRELPGLGIGSWTCSNLRIARPRALLHDGKDDFVLTIITSGQVRASQRGREIDLAPGQAVLMSAAEAGEMAGSPSPSRFFGLRLPRKALAALGSSPQDMTMRALSANTEALRLLAFYVRELDDGYQLATPELVDAVVSHLTDLGALIIGANRDGTVVAEERGLAAARLAAVKADISENLGYDLTLSAVAARLKLTPRHIQRLFEGAGSTFSEFVLGQRLARAHRLLTDPRWTDSTIGTIAFESGFGDLSYFNRTFRRHYGATPSEIRSALRRL
ncbi:AraC family transcriptional regulator [Bradyrhizobium sp. ORS 111]|uniref:AraC family transcriptional regulator n=1 Tax=Bradyrhizobium sp. ORS 111 TaxID=1685958 RepID=UPI00388D40AA